MVQRSEVIKEERLKENEEKGGHATELKGTQDSELAENAEKIKADVPRRETKFIKEVTIRDVG